MIPERDAGVSAEYVDHFDFYTRGPYAPFVQETRAAGTNPIRMIHAAQPEGDFSDPPHSDVMLVQIFAAKAPITRDYGAGRLRLNQHYGDFEIQAPNVPTTILAEGDHEVRAFVLPVDRIRDGLQDAGACSKGDFGRLHAAPFRDLFLEQLCHRLWLESEAGNPNGDLFADAALTTLAVTLSGLANRQATGGDQAPFADGIKAIITEFIETHLDGNPGLGELATLADMPQASFLKAFKATTGQTPYQYVLSRRIARAQELLAAGDMSLAEVAYACGFASQSHMTDVFRQKLGVTPGRYRKEVRG